MGWWVYLISVLFFFFFQAEDGIRDKLVTGVQTCALPISPKPDAREGQAGLPGVTERLVVPKGRRSLPVKSTNVGRGKEPWLKANARSDEGPREIGDEPSTSPKGSEVAGGVTRQSEGIARLSLLRPVRQGVPQGRAASRLCLLQSQPGRGRRGW